ncbi:hypothetical protein [Paraburkholderia sp. DGU8]|uniref:hypothetical protein n=1 Tax=Paraburkholderia sp. DGU8 TaxID=3161997 RepID=UPI003466C2D4
MNSTSAQPVDVALPFAPVKKTEKRLDQFLLRRPVMNDRYGYQSFTRFLIRRPFYWPPPPPRKLTLASPAMFAKRCFAAGLFFFTVCPVLRPGRQRILLVRRAYCNGYAMLRKTHEQPSPLRRRTLARRV